MFGWIALKDILQVKIVPFLHLTPFLIKPFSNFFSILAWAFPRMVTMNWEEKDLIETL